MVDTGVNLWLTNVMDKILSAQQALEDAHQQLQDAVLEARAHGSTWADIGQTLGMSRQAAFKRFGKPVKPTTGETMTQRSVDHYPELAERFFTRIAEGNEEATMGMLHPKVRKELSWPVLSSVWAQALAEQGELEGFEDTFVTAPKGTTPDPGFRQKLAGKMMGVAIVVTTIKQEAGELMGRVAIDDDDAIVGVYYLPVGSTDFQF